MRLFYVKEKTILYFNDVKILSFDMKRESVLF